MIVADLHLHTHHSDGLASPRQLFELARRKNLSHISITDHDTLAAYAESEKLCKEFAITLIAGVEISCEFHGQQIHLLGYGFDIADQRMRQRLASQQQARLVRLEKIIQRLAALGCNLQMDDVLQGAPASVGRPHVARAMIAKDFVRNIDEAFQKYLAFGKPAFEPVERLSINEAVDLLKNAGGISFIAHPGLYQKDPLLMIPELLAGGVDGIEVFHPRHLTKTLRALRDYAAAHHIDVVGGSDFHGSVEQRGDFATFGLDEENLAKFLRKSINKP